MEGGLQYEDIKGSHNVIHPQNFNGISSTSDCGQSNPYGEVAEGCLWVAASHFLQRRIISVWLQMIAFSLQSLRLLLSMPCLSSDSSLYLQTCNHIVALCASYVCEEEEGVKQRVYHGCVSCILRRGPLNAEHFDEVSASVIVCVWTNQTIPFSTSQLPSVW